MSISQSISESISEWGGIKAMALPCRQKPWQKWHMTLDSWHMTCAYDMWHVTHDTWPVTCDMWHMEGGEHSLKISSIYFIRFRWRCFEDTWTKGSPNQWRNELMTKVFVEQPRLHIRKHGLKCSSTICHFWIQCLFQTNILSGSIF